MITNETHPVVVKIDDKIIGFPAGMSLQEVESACQRLAASERPSSKALPAKSRRGRALSEDQAASRSKTALGGNTPEDIVARLSEMLDNVNPRTLSEQEKDEIFQQIIGYRKVARQLLSEEQRDTLDKKIAAFNNSQVKSKPAKKK